MVQHEDTNSSIYSTPVAFIEACIGQTLRVRVQPATFEDQDRRKNVEQFDETEKVHQQGSGKNYCMRTLLRTVFKITVATNDALITDMGQHQTRERLIVRLWKGF